MLALDHIGIAVENLEKGISYYRDAFGAELDYREVVPAQKVEVAFLKYPGTRIELLAATDNSSTLSKFLSTRGPGLHHICFRTSDIKGELKRLAQSGHTLIDKEPRKGAHNSLIAFVHPKSAGGVLIELCQY